MSIRISVSQLQEQLPELLDQTTESGEAYIIERDGEECAVLISMREWRARGGEPSHLSPEAAENDQDRRLQEAGATLDRLGPEYRLSPAKQARAENLLSRKSDLSRAERDELRAILREVDTITLRRAEALRALE